MRHKLEQDSKRFAKIFSFLLILAGNNFHIICFQLLFFRLAEICAAIEEMERRQREAELKRLKAQNQEWIKDFRPEGAAEFGSMPSFRLSGSEAVVFLFVLLFWTTTKSLNVL